MGQSSAYLVPKDQERFIGKGRDVAEAFWQRGVFLLLNDDDFIVKRLREWNATENRPPPKEFYPFHGGMGLTDSPFDVVVPHVIFDLCCPTCGADVTDSAYGETWAYGTLKNIDMSASLLHCTACGTRFPSRELKSDTPLTWARFYIWV